MYSPKSRTGFYVVLGIAFMAIGAALDNGFFIFLGAGALVFVAARHFRERFGGPDDDGR